MIHCERKTTSATIKNSEAKVYVGIFKKASADE
jgi:hypothetical protein